jgi:hypothetical protein
MPINLITAHRARNCSTPTPEAYDDEDDDDDDDEDEAAADIVSFQLVCVCSSN